MKKSVSCLLVLMFCFGATKAQNTGDAQIIEQYEMAIKKSPNKIELYDTLGMLYNSFREDELKAGNKEKAQEYYMKAEKNFLIATQKNANDFIANYSLGVLYCYDALALTKELIEEEPDFSATGKARYEAQKKKNIAQYKKALPYLKKVESIDPNHLETLFALKTIFGHLEDYEMLEIFKVRVKVIQDGGRHEAAYFK